MVVRVSALGGQHSALQNEDAVRYVFRELSVSLWFHGVESKEKYASELGFGVWGLGFGV